MFRRKSFWIVIAIVVLAPTAMLAWWLISPLFISKTVQEEFPFSVKAAIPEKMTRREVENVMAGMAKVNEEMSEKIPDIMAAAVKIKTGFFRDADSFHKGSGQATIYRLPDGSHTLRLEEFKVTNGPALYVILTQHPNPESSSDLKDYINLGKLKGNIGNQNYSIPADVDVSAQKSVVVYCKTFHVIFSVASVQDRG